MIAATLALVLAVQPPAAPSAPPAPWRLVYDYGGGQVLINPETLQRNGNQRTILTRRVFTRPDRDNGARDEALVQFDCSGRTFTFLHYSEFLADGTLAQDRAVTGKIAGPHPASGEQNRTLLESVCAL